MHPVGKGTYGCEEDDFAALSSLTSIGLDEQRLKETVVALLMSKFEMLSEVNTSSNTLRLYINCGLFFQIFLFVI